MSRKQKAEERYKLVAERDKIETEISSQFSAFYDELEPPIVDIQNTDCVSALINNSNNYNEITILNFASFTNPGGGWINGAWAQEESLCSESNLYNILENFKDWYEFNREHKCKGLYMNRAIFTPRVLFERDFYYKCNVLTCAAPYYRAALANGVPEETIIKTYHDRVKYIYDIMIKEKQDLLISGAWGCGVFGFPREIAMQIWKEEAKINTILACPTNTKYNANSKFN